MPGKLIDKKNNTIKLSINKIIKWFKLKDISDLNFLFSNLLNIIKPNTSYLLLIIIRYDNNYIMAGKQSHFIYKDYNDLKSFESLQFMTISKINILMDQYSFDEKTLDMIQFSFREVIYIYQINLI